MRIPRALRAVVVGGLSTILLASLAGCEQIRWLKTPGGEGDATSEAAAAPGGPAERQVMVYVGTYTEGKSRKKSRGIYSFALDLESGELTPRGVASGVKNPSFLAIHPNGRALYAVNEVSAFEGKKSGSVSAFSIDPRTGELTFLNRIASGGASPCHLSVDATGRNVLVANYSGGSVGVISVEEDGRLGELATVVEHTGSSVDPKRQKGPHAHSINLDASNRFAFAADLGLDKVLVYAFDASEGKLDADVRPAVALEPGAGPRHFTFHPNGRFAYVINELDSTVTAFSYDANEGTLAPVQTVSTLPAGFDGRNSTAEVHVGPSGRFLYGSNRGHDSIAVFAIDPYEGTLDLIEHESTRGRTPRNFEIDPTGTYLLAANQQSDSVVVFRIDPETGELEPTGHEVEVPRPVCVKFLTLGR